MLGGQRFHRMLGELFETDAAHLAAFFEQPSPVQHAET